MGKRGKGKKSKAEIPPEVESEEQLPSKDGKEISAKKNHPSKKSGNEEKAPETRNLQESSEGDGGQEASNSSVAASHADVQKTEGSDEEERGQLAYGKIKKTPIGSANTFFHHSHH